MRIGQSTVLLATRIALIRVNPRSKKRLFAFYTRQKKTGAARAPVESPILFDQNEYFAVIMTDQRWLGIGTPGVWPSLMTRFCGM